MWAHDVYKKPFPICSMYGIFMEYVPARCINLCIANIPSYIWRNKGLSMAVATTSSNAQKGFLPSESMACEQWRWASSACGSPAEKTPDCSYPQQGQIVGVQRKQWKIALKHSDGNCGWWFRNPVNSPVEVGSLSHYHYFYKGFINIPVGDRHIFPELSTICSLCASYFAMMNIWWTFHWLINPSILDGSHHTFLIVISYHLSK